MRKLFVLLTLVTALFGCDPYIDSYVPREIVNVCSTEANGIFADYKRCLERHECVIQPDPAPLSETPVYICDDEN